MVGAEALLIDCVRAAKERLRLIEPVRDTEQLGEVVEVCSNVGVDGAKGLFVDRQSTALELLGLVVAAEAFFEEDCQAVEAGRDVGMVWTEALFNDGQRTTH